MKIGVYWYTRVCAPEYSTESPQGAADWHTRRPAQEENMAHSRHLALEDLRLARDPDCLLALFRKLAYRVEPELTPLDPLDLEFPERAGIQRCFLLADHPNPPGLQVFLFELDDVRMAELRLLARDLLARPGHYLLVAVPGAPPYTRAVFVHPRRLGDGQVGIRKLVLDPTHPTRHDLDACLHQTIAHNYRSRVTSVAG